ncbi:hypothetical protein DBR45_52495 [Pseudomonas sp. HMWF031]|nr:hypothetical protein DBR45_52495 [Pseudomonas sp. HMWF031]
MGRNNSEQDLKHDLQCAASDLKWSVIELIRITERLSLAGIETHTQVVLRMCSVFHADEN